MLYSDLVEDIETLETYVTDGYTRAVLKRAANAIEELVATVGTAYNELANNEANKPRWIPVTEQLPEQLTSVIVHRKDGGIFMWEYFNTSLTDECWIDDRMNVYSFYDVTHWQPLPEPPKEEQK